MRPPRAVARSARLSQLVGLVEPGARLADVATDHAWAPIALLASGQVERAIGIDVREAPLADAAKNAARWGVEQRLSLRLGSGLWPLESGEADTVMMAGIGGALIVRLIEERDVCALGVARLILQTYTEPEVVRALIDARGWRLERELMVEERGVFYTTLIARPDEPAEAPMDERALWMGPELMARRDETFLSWCRLRRAELETILGAIPAGHADRAAHELKLGWLKQIEAHRGASRSGEFGDVTWR